MLVGPNISPHYISITLAPLHFKCNYICHNLSGFTAWWILLGLISWHTIFNSQHHSKIGHRCRYMYLTALLSLHNGSLSKKIPDFAGHDGSLQKVSAFAWHEGPLHKSACFCWARWLIIKRRLFCLAPWLTIYKAACLLFLSMKVHYKKGACFWLACWLIIKSACLAWHDGSLYT